MALEMVQIISHMWSANLSSYMVLSAIDLRAIPQAILLFYARPHATQIVCIVDNKGEI